MKLSENMKNYIPLPIPLNKPFSELSKKEADEYYNWFLTHIDERTDYLREKVSTSLNISIVCLDFSLESLKLIWKWFLQVAEISKVPKSVLKEIKKSLRGQPQSLVDHMVEQQKEGLSVFTEYVLRDIGMYLAKMFIANYPCLYWTVINNPKSYISVNEPIIMGFIDDDPSYPKPFRPDLEPISLARNPAMNLFDNTQQENDLYDWALKWIQWIPNETV